MTKKILGVRHLIAGSAIVLAAGLGTASVASASATTTTTGAMGTAPSASAPNPATLAHGPGETLLTGTALTRAVAAAKAAVPGATVVRAETDSAGSPYEVHMLKSDGTYVTVKLNDDFSVTAIQSGFGAGPAGSFKGSPPTGLPSGTPPSGAFRGTPPSGAPAAVTQ